MTPLSDDLVFLSGDEFEGLCWQLFSAQGFVFEVSSADHSPFDFAGRDASGRTAVVECKAFRQGVVGIGLREAAQQLARARTFVGAEVAYLVVNQHVPLYRRAELSHDAPWLVILDAHDVETMLASNPSVHLPWKQLIEAKRVVIRGPVPPLLTGGSLISNELTQLPRGKEHARAFEDLVVRALNYSLGPNLDTPLIQSRSDDGLDIRDAIYPIFFANDFWNWVRNACGAWFVVVECKNYTDAIGQTEVESLQQYLYRHAMRRFGVLVSRDAPSASAAKARRRAWLEFDKLIVFLGETELGDMIRAKDTGGRPERVIELQLLEFFATLTP